MAVLRPLLALTPLVLALTLSLLPAAGEVVFRVPEVLVRHAAAPRPVGTARTNDTGPGAGPGAVPGLGPGAGPGPPRSDTLLEVRYEEYFVEHEVSTPEARRAAAMLSLADSQFPAEAGCGACSGRDLQYCEWRVLADHCCCERRFVREPFPWLPHTCYVGARRCRPLARDCAQYARLRACCCQRRLAHRWKGILSRAAPCVAGGAPLLLAAAVLAACL